MIIIQTNSHKSSKSQVLSGLNCSIVQSEALFVVVKYLLTCSCQSDFWSGATGLWHWCSQAKQDLHRVFYFEKSLDFSTIPESDFLYETICSMQLEGASIKNTLRAYKPIYSSQGAASGIIKEVYSLCLFDSQSRRSGKNCFPLLHC